LEHTREPAVSEEGSEHARREEGDIEGGAVVSREPQGICAGGDVAGVDVGSQVGESQVSSAVGALLPEDEAVRAQRCKEPRDGNALLEDERVGQENRA
jgi:hypothetical protein